MLAFFLSVLFAVAIFGSTSEADEGSKTLNDIFSEISSLESQIESLNKTILSQTKLENVTKILETMETKIENLDNTVETQNEDLNKTMEVLLHQGKRQQLLNDPCVTFQYLNESWRHIDYIDRGSKLRMCDKTGVSSRYTHMTGGWFRFGSAAGTELPTFKVPGKKSLLFNQICGALYTAYITHGGHPTQEQGIVTREVCFEGPNSDCHQSTEERYSNKEKVSKYKKTIRVAACSDEAGDFYVYELQPVEMCSMAYCAIDEKTKFCPLQTPFHCHSGECISGEFECDGKKQCRDGTDENDCQPFVCPSDRPFKCKSGECITTEFVCNGRTYDGCKDDSDEQDCQDFTCPSDRPFHCTSGECRGLEGRCDGKTDGVFQMKDCMDGSDELNCTNYVCPLDNFQCKSGHCIQGYNKCDAYYHCEDHSDEENCEDHVCPFPDAQWQCKNGACILNNHSIDKRCDERKDCMDNSDEENC